MRDILSIGLACLLGIVGMLVAIDLFIVPAESEPGAAITAHTVPTAQASVETATATAAAIPAVRDVTKDPYVSGPPPASVMARLQRMAEAELAIPRPKPRPTVDQVSTDQVYDDDADTHTVTVFAAHEGGPVMRVVEVRAAPANRTRGKPRCTTFKTYNPETGTYRGYDGLIHECRAS